MTKRGMTVITGVALAAALAGGGAALATSGDDHAVTGSTADRARAAAVRYAGGRAGSVELDGEHGATYDVEVHQRRGRTVDVWLDSGFAPITSEVDSER